MDERDRIADAFARAPFEEGGWTDALRVMAGATGASRGQIVFMGERHARFNCVTDVSEDYYDDFVAIEAYRPEVNWRVAASAGPMEIVHETHYDAIRAHHTDERYLAHVRRFDAEHGVQTVLAHGGQGLFGLASLRAASDGRSNEAARETFAYAAGQALAAVRIQISLEHQAMEVARGSLDAVRVAAVLIDGDGRACGVTAGAEPVLASGAFRIAGGRLGAGNREEDARLQAALNGTLTGDPRASAEFWTRVAGSPCLVEVAVAPRLDWCFGYRPRAIVTFRFPVPVGRDDAARLTAALPLTQAEAEVVALLAAGLSRAAIAAARKTSVQTVNTQLRTIFGKCDVRREAELVARTVALLGAR